MKKFRTRLWYYPRARVSLSRVLRPPVAFSTPTSHASILRNFPNTDKKVRNYGVSLDSLMPTSKTKNTFQKIYTENLYRYAYFKIEIGQVFYKKIKIPRKRISYLLLFDPYAFQNENLQTSQVSKRRPFQARVPYIVN